MESSWKGMLFVNETFSSDVFGKDGTLEDDGMVASKV